MKHRKLGALILAGAVITAALAPQTAFAGTGNSNRPPKVVTVKGWPSGQPQPVITPVPGYCYALGMKGAR